MDDCEPLRQVHRGTIHSDGGIPRLPATCFTRFFPSARPGRAHSPTSLADAPDVLARNEKRCDPQAPSCGADPLSSTAIRGTLGCAQGLWTASARTLARETAEGEASNGGEGHRTDRKPAETLAVPRVSSAHCNIGAVLHRWCSRKSRGESSGRVRARQGRDTQPHHPA